MATYIVAEYENEKSKNKFVTSESLQKICKTASKLDDYGLKYMIQDENDQHVVINIIRDREPAPQVIKVIELK